MADRTSIVMITPVDPAHQGHNWWTGCGKRRTVVVLGRWNNAWDGGCLLYGNEEGEMVVCEWLRM